MATLEKERMKNETKPVAFHVESLKLKKGWLKKEVDKALEEYEKIPEWRKRMIKKGLD